MRKKLWIGAVLLVAGWVSSPAYAEATLAIGVENTSETLRLTLPGTNPNKIFFLENPDRLVVDVPYAPMPGLGLPRNYRGHLITGVRVGRFDAATSRIVFDLSASGTLVDKEIDSSAITITLAAGKRKTGKSQALKTEPEKPQLPLVMIDAGHGAQDPGTIGPKGTQEKDITLQYAKALRDTLVRSGRYRAELTRDTDKFIILRERIAIARRAKANVFISLHADSAPKKQARGLSVYTVSETASDAEAEALAARENKVDVLSGIDLSTERQDVADILISLAQRDTKNQSALLADQLVLSLQGRVDLLVNPHRFAGFAVLKAPDIPSVLIETGFLSHPAEEKMLNSASYRDKLVSGIISGLDKYFAVKDIVEP